MSKAKELVFTCHRIGDQACQQILATSAKIAAEEFCFWWNNQRRQYPPEQTVIAIAPDGTASTWTVAYRMVPEYTGTLVRTAEPKAGAT